MQSENIYGSRLSDEDAASIKEVLTMLEYQAGSLGAESKIAGVWRDWADLLRPVAGGATDRALDLVLDQVTPSGFVPNGIGS